MVAIDHLQHVNDTRGDDGGDAVLNAVAGSLQGVQARSLDVAGRPVAMTGWLGVAPPEARRKRLA
jgi:predicted signal transduction protein with EAL and GGDEF domain